MDERLPSPSAHAQGSQGPYQKIIYETARVLAESPTMLEAGPRMLQAVCEALDWQYGALWEVDRVRQVLRCVGMWQPPAQPRPASCAA